MFRECKTFDCQLHTNISCRSTWNKACRREAASWNLAKNIDRMVHIQLFKTFSQLYSIRRWCPTEVWLVEICNNGSMDWDFESGSDVFMGVGEEWRWLYSPPTHARGGERQGPVKMNVMQIKDQKTYLMLYIWQASWHLWHPEKLTCFEFCFSVLNRSETLYDYFWKAIFTSKQWCNKLISHQTFICIYIMCAYVYMQCARR